MVMKNPRREIMLTGTWEFSLQAGLDVPQLSPAQAEKLTYEDVEVPHDWAIRRPIEKDMVQCTEQAYRDRWGIGWYRRRETVHKQTDRKYELCFDGVYELSTVWVNGIQVGGRRYGYSPFQLDVTDALRDGENEIVVRVDNTCVPADRWYSGAGIYRKVWLLEVPYRHLEQNRIRVTSDLESDAEYVRVRVDIGEKLPLRASLSYDGQSYEAQGTGVVDITIPKSECNLWSAENPVLYELCIELLGEQQECLDAVSMHYGIRDVKVDVQRGLFINGVLTKLKGVCLHQEAGVFGTAVPKDIYRARFLELKKLGCNALRLAHHLYSAEVLDLCDEMGFYVYEEAFDKWTGGAYGRHYETEWDKDLEAMVTRDRNRPSILFWGVGNEVENQSHDRMLQLLENHVAKVKKFDETRPVTLAINPHFFWPEASVDMSEVTDIQKYVDEARTGEIFDIDDRIGQIKLIADRVDILACNYQEQWYERIHKAIPDKAILGTETYMYFRGYEEKFQNYMDRNPWLDVEENDYVIGGMIWTGIDYLGESMGWPAKGWSGALFSTDMEKKPIAWLYQSYWTKEPVLQFAVMDYTIPDEGVKEHWDYPRYVTHWDFPMFNKVVLPYMIATNCEEVTVQVADREFLVPSPKQCPNRCITGFLPYLRGTLTIVGKNAGVEVCRQQIEIPDVAVKLAFDEEPVGGRELLGQAQYLQLKVRAYDAQDRPVFRESAKVKFAVQGPATLVGVDNGDITGDEPYHNESIHLYHGHATVTIRVEGSGRIQVNAFGDGLMSARWTLSDLPS